MYVDPFILRNTVTNSWISSGTQEEMETMQREHNSRYHTDEYVVEVNPS